MGRSNTEELLCQLRRVVEVADGCRPGCAYSCPQDFALRHGAFYEAAPFPRGVRRGLPKHCFGNAIAMSALHGWVYVEGFALSSIGRLAVHHAWNLNADRQLVDSTWANTGIVYLGVEFALGRAFDAAWEGDASVLDDWKRHWPLFRQAWAGEDNALWPYEEARRKVFQTYMLEAGVPRSGKAGVQ